MFEVPHRPTMQEIQARRKSSITESRMNKRLEMSLPNSRNDQTFSFQRNTLPTGTIMSEPGESREECMQIVFIYVYEETKHHDGMAENDLKLVFS